VHLDTKHARGGRRPGRAPRFEMATIGRAQHKSKEK
jgi:hypothetical protein